MKRFIIKTIVRTAIVSLAVVGLAGQAFADQTVTTDPSSYAMAYPPQPPATTEPVIVAVATPPIPSTTVVEPLPATGTDSVSIGQAAAAVLFAGIGMGVVARTRRTA